MFLSEIEGQGIGAILLFSGREEVDEVLHVKSCVQAGGGHAARLELRVADELGVEVGHRVVALQRRHRF